MVWLGFTIERHLWGVYPVAYHFTNLLLHWSNSLLLFALLRKLNQTAGVSAIASLLWLALPINSEAVAWISGRHTLQAAFFILLSLLLALEYRRTPESLLAFYYFAAALAALLSNEWAVLYLPLTALLLYLSLNAKPPASFISLAFAAVSPLALYLPLRYASGAHLPIASLSLLPVGLTVFRYLSWIVFPIGMSVERSTDAPPDLASPSALVALAALLLLMPLLWRLRQSFPQLVAACAWTFLCLLPFSGLVFVYQGMAERYTYLASAGVAVAITVAALSIRESGRLAALVLLSVYGFASLVRLEFRLHDWRSEATLFSSSLQTTPNSAVLLFNLGALRGEVGDTQAAVHYYGLAMRANPNYVSPLLNLANLLVREGNYDEAIAFLKRAVAIEPASSDSLTDLGAAYFAKGDLSAAAAQFTQALAHDPSFLPARVDLGLVLSRSGDLPGARREFEKALSLDPGNRTARHSLETLP